MNSGEWLSGIFGPILITAVAAALAILIHFLNLRDRFLKWRKERNSNKKEIVLEKIEAEPEKIESFIFKIGFVSNSEIGKCILTISVINKSGEVKFIDPFSYNFQYQHNPKVFQPPVMVMNNEKWPMRLEHGERFATSFEFQFILNNILFQYWKKNVIVYATMRTTIGDELKSNSIEFDKLAEKLIPLNDDYKSLAKSISEKLNGHYWEVYISLWQLQIFKILTSHIGKQLYQCGIPMIKFLEEQYSLSFVKDPWYEWDKKLHEKKIQPSEIVDFLRDFLQNKNN